MSATNFCTFIQAALLLGLDAVAAQSETQNPSKSVVGAVGSSVLLPGFSDEDYKNVDHVRWAMSGRQILNYYTVTQIPTFTDLYRNRCTFYSVNGSLLLKNITLKDNGLYMAQVNLNANRSKLIKLNIFEPLSEPLIFSNSSFVDTSIAFVCQVSAGKTSSILWWKDDNVITNGQRYQLAEDNRTMVIYNAIKSDCGVYTCTAENAVSKKNVSHSLAIYGIDFHGNALLSLQFAAMISLVILFAAVMFWLLSEGISVITVITLVILCLLLIFNVLSTCSMNDWVMKRFKDILNSTFCRVMLDVVTPMSGIIVMLASIVLLVETMSHADKGCEASPGLHLSISFAVGIPIVVSLSVFVIYVQKYRKQRQNQEATPANPCEEAQGHSETSEAMPLQATASEGDGVNPRNAVNGEESCQN
ncbi:carcinoembryonic antigen-related cell adhesion molecule 2-like isoform X2 [Carcharodon carcharias]|uniref:carcinoembryonic antigen-related cell adhesion molecule 2-like isoform X2 n=1 Tax=Carcharodon carcharias TaxID=13397 RepID=UPI001B7E8154|nr:carcinoembryonic antigen-related cell adhesion molecule 2-like isoform X2 [Carcharodon carcharias]